MKLAEKVRAIAEQALQFGKHWTRTRGDYPSQILDLIIFHKLHSAMAADLALKSYRQLREKFVDWNEVRISSVREIQEELAGAPDSLQLAVFIKDLLEFVHRERQDVSLEFLAEQNLGDIRRYLKQVRGLDSATVGLILRLKKEHPVFPLNHAMESVLERLGLLRREATKDRKEKALNELVDPGQVLTLHHFILNHSHELCPPDVANVDCPRCGMRHLCAFYAQASRKRKKNSARREARLRGDGVTRRVIRSGEARRAVIRRGGTTRAGAPRGRVPRRGAQRGNRQLSPRPSSIQKRLPGKKVPG